MNSKHKNYKSNIYLCSSFVDDIYNDSVKMKGFKVYLRKDKLRKI